MTPDPDHSIIPANCYNFQLLFPPFCTRGAQLHPCSPRARSRPPPPGGDGQQRAVPAPDRATPRRGGGAHPAAGTRTQWGRGHNGDTRGHGSTPAQADIAHKTDALVHGSTHATFYVSLGGVPLYKTKPKDNTSSSPPKFYYFNPSRLNFPFSLQAVMRNVSVKFASICSRATKTISYECKTVYP